MRHLRGGYREDDRVKYDEREQVGANLFIGNLDPDVDEKLLYDTFSAFGVVITTPKIMRDPDTGSCSFLFRCGRICNAIAAAAAQSHSDSVGSGQRPRRLGHTGASRGFGFVNYDSFEASDAAIDAMNNQFLCNRPITVTYAFKKDTKGERHGSAAGAPPRRKGCPNSLDHSLIPTMRGLGADVPNCACTLCCEPCYDSHSALAVTLVFGAERLLAAQNPDKARNRPHTLFASGPTGAPAHNQHLPPPPRVRPAPPIPRNALACVPAQTDTAVTCMGTRTWSHGGGPTESSCRSWGCRAHREACCRRRRRVAHLAHRRWGSYRRRRRCLRVRVPCAATIAERGRAWRAAHAL